MTGRSKVPATPAIPLTLVVDDEPEICNLVARLLEPEGFAIITAENGERALQLASENHPDLVLLDLKMPGKPGARVLEELRAMDSDVAVVIVSGAGDIDAAVETLTQGAFDYVVKPFKGADLIRRARAALDKRRLIRENREYQRDLEQKVAEQTAHLQQKIRELHALNNLFQAHLLERDAADDAFDGFTSKILKMAEEIGAASRQVQAQRQQVRSLAADLDRQRSSRSP